MGATGNQGNLGDRRNPPRLELPLPRPEGTGNHTTLPKGPAHSFPSFPHYPSERSPGDGGFERTFWGGSFKETLPARDLNPIPTQTDPREAADRRSGAEWQTREPGRTKGSTSGEAAPPGARSLGSRSADTPRGRPPRVRCQGRGPAGTERETGNTWFPATTRAALPASNLEPDGPKGHAPHRRWPRSGVPSRPRLSCGGQQTMERMGGPRALPLSGARGEDASR